MAGTDGSTARDTACGDRFGVCQWFHFEDHRLLEATLEAMDDLGLRHLRTGVSWADWHRPAGREWYDWQMRRLEAADVEILLSVWHTPPSLSVEPALESAAVPPRRTRAFADFVDLLIQRYGDAFHHIELWNEPNNPYKWRREFDPDYGRFAEMVIDAGNWARECGKTPVLGGLTLLDYQFVDAMDRYGALDFVDVVGIHAFPGMWEPFATSWDARRHWFGWEHRVGELSSAAGGLPVWVTETGLATYHKGEDRTGREDRQIARLREALASPADRTYWYTLFDLPPHRIAIEEANGGPREEAEYHMGLIRHNPGFRIGGHQKPAYHVLRDALRRELQPAEASRRSC